jgi:hypothetical protein
MKPEGLGKQEWINEGEKAKGRVQRGGPQKRGRK